MMDQAEQLRRRVRQQAQHSGSTRVIAVTSGKGGVGKTSLSVNLAIQLSKRGKRVVIIDADFGLANVEIMLGIRPQHTMSDLIYNDMNIDDIITRGPLDIGFISGGSGVQDMVNLDREQVRMLISKLVRLDTLADVIIIDRSRYLRFCSGICVKQSGGTDRSYAGTDIYYRCVFSVKGSKQK